LRFISSTALPNWGIRLGILERLTSKALKVGTDKTQKASSFSGIVCSR
jgi:hypothetical protein